MKRTAAICAGVMLAAAMLGGCGAADTTERSDDFRLALSAPLAPISFEFEEEYREQAFPFSRDINIENGEKGATYTSTLQWIDYRDFEPETDEYNIYSSATCNWEDVNEYVQVENITYLSVRLTVLQAFDLPITLMVTETETSRQGSVQLDCDARIVDLSGVTISAPYARDFMQFVEKTSYYQNVYIDNYMCSDFFVTPEPVYSLYTKFENVMPYDKLFSITVTVSGEEEMAHLLKQFIQNLYENNYNHIPDYNKVYTSSHQVLRSGIAPLPVPIGSGIWGGRLVSAHEGEDDYTGEEEFIRIFDWTKYYGFAAEDYPELFEYDENLASLKEFFLENISYPIYNVNVHIYPIYGHLQNQEIIDFSFKIYHGEGIFTEPEKHPEPDTDPLPED